MRKAVVGWAVAGAGLFTAVGILFVKKTNKGIDRVLSKVSVEQDKQPPLLIQENLDHVNEELAETANEQQSQQIQKEIVNEELTEGKKEFVVEKK